MSGRVFPRHEHPRLRGDRAGRVSAEIPSRPRDCRERRDVGISTQVIGEFVDNVQKTEENAAAADGRPKPRFGSTRSFDFPLVEVDRQIVETALIVQRRYQLSYWDSQIVAAAERLGADVLYSEDLNHGQIYGSVRCENPFRSN